MLSIGRRSSSRGDSRLRTGHMDRKEEGKPVVVSEGKGRGLSHAVTRGCHI